MSDGTVWGQLRRLIGENVSPQRATEMVMTDLPDRWQDWARPFVLRAARDLEGQFVNKTLKQATGHRGGARSQSNALQRLHTTIYRLPDGTRVAWDDMTVDMIDLKIAQLRKHIGALVDHLRILEAARKLCADHGVARLGAIDGWPELLAALVPDANGEVVTETSVTARKPTTSTKVRVGRAKATDTAGVK